MFEKQGHLITLKGTNTCLGFLLVAFGEVFDANRGLVPIPPEDAERHNNVLSKLLVEGLDRCEVGQGNWFYLVGDTVQTFTGETVSKDLVLGKRKIKFHRHGHQFCGYRHKGMDGIFVKRVA